MGVGSTRDDRVLPVTRALSIVITPFLVLAFLVLVPYPDDTDRLFAWTIHPRFTAMLLGSVYLGGAYFFVVVAARARRWRSVRGGFVSVATFASLMGVATVVHWDRFAHSHVAFWLWAGLYFTTPFLVTLVWWANQRRLPAAPPSAADGANGADGADGADGAEDRLVGRGAQTFVALAGLLAVATSVALFLAPHRMAEVWPWALTPLTARVVGAVFALGVSGIGAIWEPRWSAYRTLLQVAFVMLALVAIAAVRARAEFDSSRPLTWVLGAGLVGTVVGAACLYLRMERRPRVAAESLGASG